MTCVISPSKRQLEAQAQSMRHRNNKHTLFADLASRRSSNSHSRSYSTRNNDQILLEKQDLTRSPWWRLQYDPTLAHSSFGTRSHTSCDGRAFHTETRGRSLCDTWNLRIIVQSCAVCRQWPRRRARGRCQEATGEPLRAKMEYGADLLCKGSGI